MRGRTHAAFEAAERLRAQEMLELLARGRVVAPSDTAVELIEREQDLRRRIAELTTAERSDDTDALRGGQTASLGDAALARAQDAYAEVLLEIREQAPAHAALVTPPSADLRDVSQRLAPDEALVEYLVSDSGTVVFVVTQDSASVREPTSADRPGPPRRVHRGALVRPRVSGRSLWRELRQLHRRPIAPLEETGCSPEVATCHRHAPSCTTCRLRHCSRCRAFLVERFS
jgi:hypothetical protein